MGGENTGMLKHLGQDTMEAKKNFDIKNIEGDITKMDEMQLRQFIRSQEMRQNGSKFGEWTEEDRQRLVKARDLLDKATRPKTDFSGWSKPDLMAKSQELARKQYTGDWNPAVDGPLRDSIAQELKNRA